jgi:DNA-binding transcriptional MerR regulator
LESGDQSVSELPQKEFYKLSEVCQYTDTQPYVLRFWESEFPQLRPEKSGNGQRVYSREDLELVQRIKELLHDQECTLESARKELEGGSKGGAVAKNQKARPSRKSDDAREAGSSTAAAAQPPAVDPISRQRYEDAVEEIEVLRLQLKEAEKQQHKAELARKEADGRAARVGQRIEKLLERLG